MSSASTASFNFVSSFSTLSLASRLDVNGVAWGQGNSPGARRRRRAREATQGSQASTLPLLSQGGSPAPSVHGSDRSSVISYDSAELTADFFSGDGSLNGRYNKLDVLQAMLIEFGLKTTQNVPTSINKCSEALRADLHINIKDYLRLKQSGESIAALERFPTTAGLRKDLRRTKNFVALKQAKREMRQPLLVKLCPTLSHYIRA